MACTCPVCRKVFLTPFKMNLHLNKAHKKELGVDLKGLTNSTIGEVNGLRAAQEDTDLLTAQLVDLIGTSTQVWSLTQFYSVDFSQSRIGVNMCLSNKRTISCYY